MPAARCIFTPRAHCPFCFSDNTGWQQASGDATIYTYSVMRRGAPVPYAIAYVTLAEGPTMMTNIVDCDLDGIRIGQEGQTRVQAQRRRPAGAVLRARLNRHCEKRSDKYPSRSAGEGAEQSEAGEGFTRAPSPGRR